MHLLDECLVGDHDRCAGQHADVGRTPGPVCECSCHESRSAAPDRPGPLCAPAPTTRALPRVRRHKRHLRYGWPGWLISVVVALGVLVAVAVAIPMLPSDLRLPGMLQPEREARHEQQARYYYCLSGSGGVWVATDRWGYDRRQEFASAGDAQGILDLESRGRVMRVPSGTRCRPISGFLVREVRILEGAYEGSLVWTAADHIVRRRAASVEDLLGR